MRNGRGWRGRLFYRILSALAGAAEGTDIALHICRPVFFSEACAFGVGMKGLP